MAENIWDEIWNKPAFSVLSYSPDELEPVPGKISVNKDWLHEVKAEGDRLKEKAEKYEVIKEAFINYFGDIDTDVINNEDFEAAIFAPCDSYYFANATRKILEEGE